jgi:hypothetical protein
MPVIRQIESAFFNLRVPKRTTSPNQAKKIFDAALTLAPRLVEHIRSQRDGDEDEVNYEDGLGKPGRLDSGGWVGRQ